MNIQHKKIMIFGAVATILIAFGIGITMLLDKNTDQDPLSVLLENSLQKDTSAMKADFISGTPLTKYSGPISTTLQQCINGLSDSNAIEVNATVDREELIKMIEEKENGTYPVSRMKEEIDPVFGFAMRANSINWVWNMAEYSYTFKVHSGDARLWACYFKHETPFFSRFLDSKSVSYEGPTICPALYEPVCGLRPGLQIRETFSNRCVAENANATNITDGACSGDNECPAVYAPVCGLLPDSNTPQTFTNQCYLEKSRATKVSDGVCQNSTGNATFGDAKFGTNTFN